MVGAVGIEEDRLLEALALIKQGLKPQLDFAEVASCEAAGSEVALRQVGLGREEPGPGHAGGGACKP